VSKKQKNSNSNYLYFNISNYEFAASLLDKLSLQERLDLLLQDVVWLSFSKRALLSNDQRGMLANHNIPDDKLRWYRMQLLRIGIIDIRFEIFAKRICIVWNDGMKKMNKEEKRILSALNYSGDAYVIGLALDDCAKPLEERNPIFKEFLETFSDFIQNLKFFRGMINMLERYCIKYDLLTPYVKIGMSVMENFLRDNANSFIDQLYEDFLEEISTEDLNVFNKLMTEDEEHVRQNLEEWFVEDSVNE